MIPPFDPFTGNLPPGVHTTSWDEFQGRFGLTPDRRMLLEKLGVALAHLAFCGCRKVYVDGSFVTASDIPGDYDICWEIEGVDARLMRDRFPGLGFRTRRERLLQREVYGGDIFPSGAVTITDTALVEFLEFFQRDKITGAPKGILSIELVSEL